MTSLATNTASKKLNQSETQRKVQELKSQGVTGIELFQAIAAHELHLKKAAKTNRCNICWHDLESRCICPHIPRISSSLLPVKFLILMHHKEYLNAGNTAKLLLAMLPSTHVELFIFGIASDWKKFESELSIDPTHTMTLWPGVNAITINEFLLKFSNDDALMLKQNHDARNKIVSASTVPSSTTPSTNHTLRVVVLDGVYNHASNMYKNMRKRLPIHINPPAVALHPLVLSTFHRASKRYAKDSALSVKHSSDPKALRISTVEAVALLLSELKEDSVVTDALIEAVKVNNQALIHSLSVRPKNALPESKTSGAAKRKTKKKKAENK